MRKIGENKKSALGSAAWADIITAAENAGNGVVLQSAIVERSAQGTAARYFDLAIYDGTNRYKIWSGYAVQTTVENLPLVIPPGWRLQAYGNADGPRVEVTWDDLP